MVVRTVLFAIASGLALLVGCSSDQPRSKYLPDGTKATNYPFAVTVDGFDSTGKPSFKCSGALVSPTLVLTAGQCAEAATWTVRAPYAGGQTAQAEQATPGEYQKIALGQFDPAMSDVGYVLLKTPIQLSSYPALADSRTCNACEVVHIGRVAHIKDGTVTPEELEGIAAGNAGGPIVRVADGAIIGVSAGTLAPHDKVVLASTRVRDLSDPVQQAANGSPTYWSTDDLWESPLHVAVPNGKSVYLFPQRTLYNLPPATSPEAASSVATLLSTAGIGSGGAPAVLQQYAGAMMNDPATAPKITQSAPPPPSERAMRAIVTLNALMATLTPDTLPPFMPPVTTGPSIAMGMSVPSAAPIAAPITPPTIATATPAPVTVSPSPYMDGPSAGQILNGVFNILNIAGGISNLLRPPYSSYPQSPGLGLLGNIVGSLINNFGNGFDMGGECS